MAHWLGGAIERGTRCSLTLTETNVVAACGPCNLHKGCRMPRQAGMQLLRWPIEPTSFQLQEHGRSFPPNYLHESWRDFLYWDSELEQF